MNETVARYRENIPRVWNTVTAQQQADRGQIEAPTKVTLQSILDLEDK